MTFVLLGLTLASAPPLWVTTQGFESDACSADAFAAAVRTQRPTTNVHAWYPERGKDWPPPGAIRVRLALGDSVTLLEVTGAINPLARTLPAADGCERNVEIAALIVDGALDSLELAEAAPAVDSLAPPVPLTKQLHLSAALGAGTEQGPLGFVPAIEAQGASRWRLLELTLDADVGLPASAGFPSTLQGGAGSLSVTELDAELGLGLAPRLGPGRFSADLVAGLSFVFATVSGSGLFQQTPQQTTELFVGLRLGYVFDLPLGFFFGARIEEQLAPEAATLTVANANQDFSAKTRTWTLQALGLIGYRFF